jgi:transcription-repair coupling factor (superfamily II helicase)
MKALRAEVDMLTLTATPIPRTLNMAMAGMRDLSIIATPPAGRLAVKTFVSQWNKATIQEACQRELKRGGQIYFLHNEVETIQRMAAQVAELAPDRAHRHRPRPDARAGSGAGDAGFLSPALQPAGLHHHHRIGIDVPSANTIIINRADKLGLAQLHQLRGRVGRSHHRAYAYLIVPPAQAMTTDAVKRIEAIESLEDLGAGFRWPPTIWRFAARASCWARSRAARFTRSVSPCTWRCWSGRCRRSRPARCRSWTGRWITAPEIELQSPALIPDDYLPDVHSRLIHVQADRQRPRRGGAARVAGGDDRPLRPAAGAGQNLFRVTGLETAGHAGGGEENRGGTERRADRVRAGTEGGFGQAGAIDSIAALGFTSWMERTSYASLRISPTRRRGQRRWSGCWK